MGVLTNAPVKVFNSSGHGVIFANTYNVVFNDNIEVSNTSTGQITFGPTGGSSVCKLASGKTLTVGSGGFGSGTLLFNRFLQLGSTAQTITLTGATTIMNIVSSTFNGDLTLTAPTPLMKSCTFNGNVSLTKASSGTNAALSDGDNTFNGTLTITNSASGAVGLRMSNQNGDTYNGNVTLNTTNGVVVLGYVDTSFFAGDISINNTKASFNGSTGIVELRGSSNQTIGGTAAVSISRLRINKSGGSATLNQPANIDTAVVFVKGLLNTDSTNVLSLKKSVSVSGASDSSYVDGFVKKIGNSSFAFPVGDGGRYLPIEITAPSVNTDAFLAEYTASGQNIGTNKDGSIKFLDNCNYWKLYRTTGSSAVNVKLSWQAAGCPLLDSASILVANWNGSTWKDLGRTSFTGNRNNGTITNSSAVNSFNRFTFGYTACQLSAYIVGSGDSLKAKCLNGTPSYTYLWSTGATTSYILGSQAGTTYTVTITDASGCSDNSSISRIFQKVTSGPVVNEANNSYYATWGDYDNDSDLDLFHSLFFNAPNNPSGNNFLFQNNCNGNLTKVGSIPGGLVSSGLTGSYSKWVDFDNDGDKDLYVGPNYLYENLNDGSFSAITNQITTLPTYAAPLRDAGFADYDNDGLLDVYFGHGKIYKNDGLQDFTEVTISGFSSISTSDRCDAIAWADYDNDRYMDVLVTNSNASVSNYLFHNNGNGTFSNITSSSDLVAASQNSYGCAWGDIDNDMDLDLWLNNNATGDRLFINNGSGVFNLSTSENLTTNGVAKQAGAALADFDNDGDLDLFVPSFSYNYLFYNNGSGHFTKDSVEVVTSDLLVESYSGSFADYDNDGDLDLFVPTAFNSNPNDLFYENTLNPTINPNHNFVKFNCLGQNSNADAIGTRIKIYATINGISKWQMREINGNSSRAGESGALSSGVIHFGVGNATIIDSVKVYWPKTNSTQVFTSVNVNEFYRVYEDSASLYIVTPCTEDIPLENLKVISGVIYNDVNSNCVFNSGTDMPLAKAFVKANPGNYYTQTNDSGYYYLRVPEGSYTVDANFYNTRWNLQSCTVDSAYSISTVGVDTVGNIDFAEEMRFIPCNGTFDMTITPMSIDPADCPSGLFVRGPCPGYLMGYCFDLANNSTLASGAGTFITIPLPMDYTYVGLVQPPSLPTIWATNCSAPNPYTITYNTGTNTITIDLFCDIPIGGNVNFCLAIDIDFGATIAPIEADHWQNGTNTNLVTNGSFDACSTATSCGFTTGYNYNCSLPIPGNFCILGDANQYHNQWHGTSLSIPNMMVMDGVGATDIWCQNITVQNNTRYTVAYVAQSVNWGSDERPIINTLIDGVIQHTTTPLYYINGWEYQSFTYCATASGTVPLCFELATDDEQGNDFAIDNIEMVEEVVFPSPLMQTEDCSCDPNNLHVTPEGCGINGNIQKNQNLTYRMHFENIGTGNAHNVYIVNQLDDDLDLSTLRILEVSHPYSSFQINADNSIIMVFNGIELEPDSVGYLTYTIDPKVGLTDGTIIKNQGEIYFDNNDVVLTNVVVNTLYDEPYPSAKFNYTLSCSNPDLAYDFEYSGSTSDGANYSWVFEDGSPSTSTLQDPADIEFSSVGYKLVTLTVSRYGCTAFYSDTVLVTSYFNEGKDSLYICHSNSLILINIDSLHNHLSHGDCIGYCIGGERLSDFKPKMEFDVMVKPNPTSGNFKLEVSYSDNLSNDFKVQIFNALGSNINLNYSLTKKRDGILVYDFDASALSSGLYFVRVDDGELHRMIKVIVQ